MCDNFVMQESRFCFHSKSCFHCYSFFSFTFGRFCFQRAEQLFCLWKRTFCMRTTQQHHHHQAPFLLHTRCAIASNVCYFRLQLQHRELDLYELFRILHFMPPRHAEGATHSSTISVCCNCYNAMQHVECCAKRLKKRTIHILLVYYYYYYQHQHQLPFAWPCFLSVMLWQ